MHAVLSLSLFLLGCSSATFSSSSFSGTGEIQTLVVWVSPCDSSSRTRTSTSTRTSCSTPTPRSPPVAVFFCSSPCSRRCSDFFSLSLYLSLSPFCLVFWFVVCFALCMHKYKIKMGRVVLGTTAPLPLSSLLLGGEQLAGNCTVAFVSFCSPVEGGNAVRFCHIRFFVFGSASFVLFCCFFLLGSLLGINFRERTFVFFFCLVVACCF